MAVSGKYGQITVEREPGNPLNGTDEPVFLLRARDKTAVLALVTYQQSAKANGAGPMIEVMMNETIIRFREWQKAHPDLVKAPD